MKKLRLLNLGADPNPDSRRGIMGAKELLHDHSGRPLQS